MKKQFITGFVSATLIFGVAGVLAATFTATDNPFPVQLNGEDVQIEGYNIEGSTYFKLRDIADVVGGFDVGFQNDTIQLSKDGYVYPEISEVGCSKVYSDLGWIYETEPKVSRFEREEYVYTLPQFNLNSKDAKEFNSRIFELHEDAMSISISFEDYVNGDILSLAIKDKKEYNDVVEYSTYNIDLSTGNKISNSELVRMAGITENEFLSSVKTVLKQSVDAHLAELSDEFKSNADSLYEQSFSKCNIDMQMYVDGEKNIIAIPYFATLAGGYRKPINTGYKINF